MYLLYIITTLSFINCVHTSSADATIQTGDVSTVDMLDFDQGLHWRCITDRGALHIWVPFEYEERGAGVVLYVHGYAVNVDEAWRDYGLARQFRMSQRNAVFILPEAPKGKADEVSWPSLQDLRAEVKRCGFNLPRGPWVAMGHSAAYRTLKRWVRDRYVRCMILLDALYAGQAYFKIFVERPRTKMILVSTETSEHSLAFSERFSDTLRYSKLPLAKDLDLKARRARLLYFKSTLTHHEVAASGAVTPRVLQIIDLPKIRRF